VIASEKRKHPTDRLPSVYTIPALTSAPQTLEAKTPSASQTPDKRLTDASLVRARETRSSRYVDNPPTPRKRGVRSMKVDRQEITAEEADQAQVIHAALNEITGAADLLDFPLLRGIVRRLRAHTLTADDHREIIGKAHHDRSATLPVHTRLYGKDPAYFAAYLDNGKPRREVSTAAAYIRRRPG
jgi:hypothetical protein